MNDQNWAGFWGANQGPSQETATGICWGRKSPGAPREPPGGSAGNLEGFAGGIFSGVSEQISGC